MGFNVVYSTLISIDGFIFYSFHVFDKLFNQRIHAITHHNIYMYINVEVSIVGILLRVIVLNNLVIPIKFFYIH